MAMEIIPLTTGESNIRISPRVKLPPELKNDEVAFTSSQTKPEKKVWENGKWIAIASIAGAAVLAVIAHKAGWISKLRGAGEELANAGKKAVQETAQSGKSTVTEAVSSTARKTEETVVSTTQKAGDEVAEAVTGAKGKIESPKKTSDIPTEEEVLRQQRQCDDDMDMTSAVIMQGVDDLLLHHLGGISSIFEDPATGLVDDFSHDGFGF